MTKRFEWSHPICNRWCKVHFWYNFVLSEHMPYPEVRNILTSTHGWMHVNVHIGPPAWLPKRPSPVQLAGMEMVCPHDPPQLTCQTCRRHEFRPLLFSGFHRDDAMNRRCNRCEHLARQCIC